MWVNAIVRLCVDKVAIGSRQELVRVRSPRELKDRLARNAVPIPTLNRNRRAKIIAESVRNSRCCEIVKLRIKTQPAVANLVVPFCRGLIVPRSTEVGVLCLLGCVIRNTVQE